ncbi:MAG: hypothetical protein ABGY72_14335, partial [bacterium]
MGLLAIVVASIACTVGALTEEPQLYAGFDVVTNGASREGLVFLAYFVWSLGCRRNGLVHHPAATSRPVRCEVVVLRG